jgi:hypothetical protein
MEINIFKNEILFKQLGNVSNKILFLDSRNAMGLYHFYTVSNILCSNETTKYPYIFYPFPFPPHFWWIRKAHFNHSGKAHKPKYISELHAVLVTYSPTSSYNLPSYTVPRTRKQYS